MTIRGYAINKLYELLNDFELGRIHEATLDILERAGVRIESEYGRKILAAAGCYVDNESRMVRFPPNIVETAMKSCTGSFTFKHRDPQKDVRFSTSHILYANGVGIQLQDRKSGQRRHAVAADVPEVYGFLGALENIDVVFPAVTFISDRPMLLNYERGVLEALKYSPKPFTVGGPFGHVDPKWHMLIAEAAGASLIGGGPVGSPFTFDQNLCDSIILYAEKGWPVLVTGGANMGATCPATFAGSLIQQNAEVLAGICMAKIVNPGCPVLYGTFVLPMDMRIAAVVSGGVETSLNNIATAQIARYYNVPSFIFAPMTDSKVPDQQAGYEKGMQWILNSIAGINAVFGAGILENEDLLSYEQLVIDNEMIGMTKHFMRGILFNDETMALDAIHAVGPIPGHYLKSPFTKEWWKKEQYLAKISDRAPHNVWIENGAKDVVTRAKEKVEEIFKKLDPAPVLPDDVCNDMEKIFAEAEKYEMARLGPPAPGA